MCNSSIGPGKPLSEPAAILPEGLSAAVGAVTADPIVIVGDAAIRAASALDERCEATIVEIGVAAGYRRVTRQRCGAGGAAR